MSDESDYDGGFFRNLSGLATDWVTSKRRALERRGTPNTFTDSGGTISKYSWDGQDISQAELAKVRDIREKGGVIAQLFHAKALIRFGTGVELQAENDDLQTLLNDELFPDLDLLVLDLGEDAIFYPYALGELVPKRGNGGFSHVEPIEPWTMLPETDDHGDIIRWQHHVGPGEAVSFDTDDIGHIAINKSCGRDKVGISDVLRSEDEIEQYKNNQRAINNAIEVAGFPHILWKVGREGGTPIADDELRRVRSIVESIKSDSQIVMGRDIDTEQINPSEFKFGDITERDLRVLTSTIGLPFELVGYGSDGLGSGHEADLKMQLLRIQNEADRRRFADQFIREFVNPVIEQYTPYSPDEDVTLRFESFLDDKQDMATWIGEVGEYMRNDDVVETLGLPPIEDEETATAYRPPQQIEEAEEGPDEGGFGGGGGLFSDGRALQEVPANARPISDPSECNGSVVRGPQGGTYCVPEGGDNGDGGGASDTDTVDSPNAENMRDFAQQVEKPDNDDDARQLQRELYSELDEQYDEDIVFTRPREVDGELKFPVSNAFTAWEEGGYWSNAAAPVWHAAQDASGRDAEIPIDTELDDPNLMDRDAYFDGVEDAIQDVIAFSQAFVAENMEGESVEVTRGIKEDLAEQAIAAKEAGEPLEIDPHAMESWSTDSEAAEGWGDVVLRRELTPEDVAFYGPAAIPDEFDDQEITALGREPYEIDLDAIEIVQD